MDRRLVLQFAEKKTPNMKQLKHLPKFLSPKERAFAKTLVAIAAIALIAIGTKFAGAHIVRVPADGGDYIEASVGAPREVNPVLASTNDADLDLIKLTYSGLVTTTSDGAIAPDLASSYDVSADGKIYTFHLQNGIRWHDGERFTAKDAVFTINAIKDSAWNSPLAGQFKNVAVAAPDDATVTFTLQEPFAPFLSLLTVGILPEHLWQGINPANASRAELNLKPVGTGPFRFKSYAKDKRGAILSYTLVRNEAYYGSRPHLDSVTFKFYPDFGSANDALLGHRVDGLGFLPLEYRDVVEKIPSLRLTTLRLPQYTAIFFNQKRNAALSSKNVRQALAYAIDRNRILHETAGVNGVLVSSPILDGFVGFDPDVKKYDQDLAKAAALLDRDGWHLDADGVRKQQMKQGKTIVKTPLEITITTVDTKENTAVAEAIKKDWTGVGVQTVLDIVPANRIQKDKIRPRDYEALLYGEILGPDPDPYPFWHSSQTDESGLNLAVYANRRVDELLEKARQTTKDADRAPLYREFQDILADEVPAIFLYSPTYSYVVSRRVLGVAAATIFEPADRFNDVENWYIATKSAWK